MRARTACASSAAQQKATRAICSLTGHTHFCPMAGQNQQPRNSQTEFGGTPRGIDGAPPSRWKTLCMTCPSPSALREANRAAVGGWELCEAERPPADRTFKCSITSRRRTGRESCGNSRGKRPAASTFRCSIASAPADEREPAQAGQEKVGRFNDLWRVADWREGA